MKCVLEFGKVRGALCENVVVPTGTLGASLAANLVHVFGAAATSRTSALPTSWKLSRHVPRRSWTDGTHFVALSALDGIPRGPAAASLWKGPQ
jgi:hypothetical protein